MERYITYEEFGAVGDGVTDDFSAICRAHAAANEQGIPVRAKDDATYYIAAVDHACEVRTDVEWGKAHFIIDDRKTDNKTRMFQIFSTEADIPDRKLGEEELRGISLSPASKNIGLKPGYPALVFVIYKEKRNYNRWGCNANGGTPVQEVILVDADGNIDESTPVLFDYPALSEMQIYCASERPITLHGGIFTTYANCFEREYRYHYRGIRLHRSNTVVDGVEHYIEKEGEDGAPYFGFLYANYATHITIRNCKVTAHRAYPRAVEPNNVMGSYDLAAWDANDVLIENTVQTNSIIDPFYWGIHTADYCKNLKLTDSTLNRFDAHCGMHNCTVLRSTLGIWLNCIGSGLLYIDGLTRLIGEELVFLRDDYGSTWQGDVVIKNAKLFGYEREWHPARILELKNPSRKLCVFHTSRRDWDFGYTCYMPTTMTIENLQAGPDGKAELTCYKFGEVTVPCEKNPYVMAKKVVGKNIAAEKFFLSNRPDVLPEDTVDLSVELA